MEPIKLARVGLVFVSVVLQPSKVSWRCSWVVYPSAAVIYSAFEIVALRSRMTLLETIVYSHHASASTLLICRL